MHSSESQPHISIVLNVHNEDRFLSRTARSINQAVRRANEASLSVEIIVVLDNASIETANIVREQDWGTPPNLTKIVSCSFGSLGLSRNYGFEHAAGVFVSTADADDLISENFLLDSYVAAKNANTDKFVVLPEYVIGFGARYYIYKLFDSSFIPSCGLFDYHPFLSKIFIARSHFAQFRYIHTDHNKDYAFEDWDYNARLVANGFIFIIAKECVLYYRQRSNSLLSVSARTSLGLIPPSEFFGSNIFDLAHPDINMCDNFGKFREISNDIIKRDYLESESLLQFELKSNRIDPAISRLDISKCPVSSNLNGTARRGIVYAKARALLNSLRYDDVIILPYMTSGGGEKYILNILSALESSGMSRRMLFLTGENAAEHRWLERLPPNSDFIDLRRIVGDDSDDLDTVALRLIQTYAGGARVHVKASPFGHRFISKYGKCLSGKTIYYRFCDDVYLTDGETFVSGWGFNHISENYDNYDLFVSDHKKILELDRARLCYDKEKAATIYNECDIPIVARGYMDNSDSRLLWASRIGYQKRPELLVAIANALDVIIPGLKIEIAGYPDAGYDVDRFVGLPNVEYIGPFTSFEKLMERDYDLLVYTSHFDGLPNLVLEAMSHGLPVIAPELGGLPEGISNGETGFLVACTGDDARDAERYVEAIQFAISDPARLRQVGLNGRAQISSRHERSEFVRRVQEIFGGLGD